MAPLKVLYVTTYDPLRQDLGGASWVDGLILDAIGTEHDVETFVVCELAGEPAVPLEIRGSRIAIATTLTRMAFAAEPYQAAKFRHARAWTTRGHQLEEQAERADIVVTSQWPALLLSADAGVPVHLHLGHNVDTVLARRHDPLPFRLLNNAARMQRLERRLLASPGQRIMLSRTDVTRLREWGLTAQHLTLTTEQFQAAPSRRHRVGFLGKMSWPPNRLAADRLVHEVMPRVRRLLGDRAPHIVVAGRGSERYADVDGITALGTVANLEEFYRSVDLVVVPRSGESTGVSVKMLESLHNGVPAVVPEVLASDAGVTCGAIVADGVEATADAIVTYFASLPSTKAPPAADGATCPPSLRLRDLATLIASAAEQGRARV